MAVALAPWGGGTVPTYLVEVAGCMKDLVLNDLAAIAERGRRAGTCESSAAYRGPTRSGS
jgi:hypothetical protein